MRILLCSLLLCSCLSVEAEANRTTDDVLNTRRPTVEMVEEFNEEYDLSLDYNNLTDKQKGLVFNEIVYSKNNIDMVEGVSKKYETMMVIIDFDEGVKIIQRVCNIWIEQENYKYVATVGEKRYDRVKVDGVLGPMTVRAINRIRKGDYKFYIREYIAEEEL